MINGLVYFFFIGILGSAFMTIYASNSVFSLLFLISAFLIMFFSFFVLECEFLSLLFVLIYVGAIAILFLFSIMMLEAKSKNLLKNTMLYFPIAFIFGLLFVLPLSNEFTLFFKSDSDIDQSFYYNTYVSCYDFVDIITDVKVYGQVLYSYYILQFLVVGLILLLVLIGILYLTNSYKLYVNDNVSSKQLSRDVQVLV